MLELIKKLSNGLQLAQNRILRTCLYGDRLADTVLLHQHCKNAKLQDRRILHLNLYKQQNNVNIVNIRNVRTRAHDALLFSTVKPHNEEYKRSVFL